MARQQLRLRRGTYSILGLDRNYISEGDTVSDAGIEDGDTVTLYAGLVGGKPVIYLYLPTDISASVKLFLVPEWQLSAIYPVVLIKQERGEHIE